MSLFFQHSIAMKTYSVFFLILAIFTSELNGASVPRKYRSNVEIHEFLRNVTLQHPNISSLYSIGKSTGGTDLLVIRISATKPDQQFVPNVKLIGQIHGNEAVGREILLNFIEFLVENYNVDTQVTSLLNTTNIHVMPTLNPDGFDRATAEDCKGEVGRRNNNDIDLNRSFPDFFHSNTVPEQIETKAVKQWMSDILFILSAALHGGALVVNYPFDTEKLPSLVFGPKRRESKTPDDDVFKYLAGIYAKAHNTMHLGEGCQGEKFPGGITNGAKWMSFKGTMSDYNYFRFGCMELTLELTCCKYPSASELPKLWEQNKEALLEFCKRAHMGVRGVILDAKSGRPCTNISLKIGGRDAEFRTSQRGEFWRILLPGNYTLEVLNSSIPFTVKEYKPFVNPTTLTLLLHEDGTVTDKNAEPKRTTTARPTVYYTDRATESTTCPATPHRTKKSAAPNHTKKPTAPYRNKKSAAPSNAHDRQMFFVPALAVLYFA